MEGAFFIKYSTLPLELAWKAFGEANGMQSLALFRQKIGNLRREQALNPSIICIIFTQPFSLGKAMYIDPPRDWPSSLVTGKSFEILPGSEGLRLFEQAQQFFSLVAQSDHEHSEPAGGRYGKDFTIRPRLGQGGVRIMVLDEYCRRCAITGEKTLPVLEAAHTQPYSENGPHKLSNGILMRSDLHTLFNNSYLGLADLPRSIAQQLIPGAASR